MNVCETLNFKDMPEEQVREVIAKAEAELERRRQLKVAEVRGQIKVLADSVGMRPEDLVAAKPARGNRGKSKPVREVRYRNSANPAETWTGRGKRPHWLAQALSAGASLDSFRVN
jgi:DNA-binding protein H-NS